MSTCQTCCYWKRNPPLDEWDDAAPSPLFGDCGCPRVVYGDTRQNVIYYAPKQVNEDYTYASRPRSELLDSGNADMLLYQDYSCLLYTSLHPDCLGASRHPLAAAGGPD